MHQNLLLICGLILAFAVRAQKPVPLSPLAIIPATENEGWFMDGNKRISELSGFPAAIYQINEAVPAVPAEEQARIYLLRHLAELGLTETDLTNLQLHAVRNMPSGTAVRLRQLWKGLPVNRNAEITIHINPRNEVDFLMNGFVYGVAKEDVVPVVSAGMAREIALNHLHVTGDISFESNSLMIFHHKGQDYLVHRVIIEAPEPGGEWECLIDAKTGVIRSAQDISAYHHHPNPPDMPLVPLANSFFIFASGTANAFIPDPLATANATYGSAGFTDNSDANSTQLQAQLQPVSLLNITFSGGNYSLVGPYAEIKDFEAPNKGLFSQASSVFNFNRFDDGFEAANVYFHIDQSMRYLNTTLGLAVAPYQYVGGVQYDPHGLSGSDNSHYLSGSGRVAFGEGGVDDAEDADVVIHELGHGLHDWFTAGGLSQTNGLSEGCGDYWAASYSRSLGNWSSGQAPYNWVFKWDGHNPFWNGRITNYTALYPGGLVGQVHADGQIWATSMMHVYDDIGRTNADIAFWTGISMTNSIASQNDAANAVYQAAINLGYSYADRLAIHTRFTATGYTLPAFPLPLDLISFTGKPVNNQDALLEWVTENERGTAGFTVEKSLNGKSFAAIGKVAVKTGPVKNDYHFTDDKAGNAQMNYYRLRQEDIDGAFSYSPVVSVQFAAHPPLSVFPNPAGEVIYLNNTFGDGTVTLFNAQGQEVFHTQETSKSTVISIPLHGFAPGIYWLQVSGNGSVQGTTIIH